MRLVLTIITDGQKNYYLKEGKFTFCLTTYDDFDEEHVTCSDGKKWTAVNDPKIIKQIKEVIK